jgi:hypothetical protein
VRGVTLLLYVIMYLARSRSCIHVHSHRALCPPTHHPPTHPPTQRAKADREAPKDPEERSAWEQEGLLHAELDIYEQFALTHCHVSARPCFFGGCRAEKAGGEGGFAGVDEPADDGAELSCWTLLSSLTVRPPFPRSFSRASSTPPSPAPTLSSPRWRSDTSCSPSPATQ